MNRKDKRFGCYAKCKNFRLLRPYAKLNNILVIPLPSGGRLKHIERRSFLNMRDLRRFSFSQNARFFRWTFYRKVSLKNIFTPDFKSLDKTNNFLSLFCSIASFSATQRKVTSFKNPVNINLQLVLRSMDVFRRLVWTSHDGFAFWYQIIMALI